MKLREIRVEPIHYRLREALRTSRGWLELREGVRVSLECADGEAKPGARAGIGEALPLAELGTESPAECSAAAQQLARSLGGAQFELEAFLRELESASRELGAPAARAAFDLAAHDLASRQQGVAVARLCTPPGALQRPLGRVRVNAVCGAADPLRAAQSARRAVELGYRTLKLKVGAGEPDEDRARIAAVRSAVGPALALRIDANGAWSPERALAVLAALAPFGIELCEQPVAARDLAGLARVHEASPVPIAADEALALAEGRAACAEGTLASFAILKPTALGGLRPAAELAARAAARGVRCLATTTFDGPRGSAAALALAAAVGDAQLAHGLDAAAHVLAPFPEALRARAGELQVPCAAGLLPDD